MAPRRKARIGVLLTVGRREAIKEQLVNVRKKPLRPWLKHTPANLRIERKRTTARAPTVGVPSDVSIAEYIKFNHGDRFDVDYIHPKDVTVERLDSNDVNFMLTYDLLEAFHVSPNIFEKFKDVLSKSRNVFPNLAHQEFVYSKLLYYNHFEAHGLPVAPTITVSKEQWRDRIAKVVANSGRKLGGAAASAVVAGEILEEVKKRGFEKFIAKPVWGQEGKDCKRCWANTNADRFAEYLSRILEKYPGVVLQSFIKGFGYKKESPELRMYFVGRQYQFTFVCSATNYYTLEEHGRQLRLPPQVDFEEMKRIASRAIDCMPRIELARGKDNVVLPSLLTRVDMGCLRDGIFKPWINEVEFVPSLYTEDHSFLIDQKIAEQMVAITHRYLKAAPAKRASRQRSTKRLPLSVRWPKKQKGPRPLVASARTRSKCVLKKGKL